MTSEDDESGFETGGELYRDYEEAPHPFPKKKAFPWWILVVVLLIVVAAVVLVIYLIAR